MKLKTLLVSAVALLCSAASWGYTTTDLTNAGWTSVTSLPTPLSDYYFVFVDNGGTLMLDYATGAQQGSDRKTMYYRTNANPFTTPTMVWTLADNTAASGAYSIKNATEPTLYLQCEWENGEAPRFCHTNDNGAGTGIDRDWCAYNIVYADSKWTIQTWRVRGQAESYVGPWDNTIENDAEVAGNKSGSSIGYFQIYAIKRSEAPLDFTSKITNPSFESDLADWTNSGMGTQGNTFFGKTGTKYTEAWEPNGTKSIKQTLSGLPAGLYCLSAHAKARGVTSAKIYAGSNETAITVEDKESDYLVYFTSDGSSNVEIGFEGVGTGAGASWLAVDNFQLTTGTNVITAAVDMPSDGTVAANKWYKVFIPTAGNYDVTSTNAATIYYSQDGTTAANAGTSLSFAAAEKKSIPLSVGYLYIRSSAAQTLNVDTRFYLATTVNDETKWLNKNASGYTYAYHKGLPFTLESRNGNVVLKFSNGNYLNDVGSNWQIKAEGTHNDEWKLSVVDGGYKLLLGVNNACQLFIAEPETGLVEITHSTNDGNVWRFVQPEDALASAIATAESHTLGFEDGEYAPYNNTTPIAALATAKAATTNDARISAYTALTDATWTANAGEVNAFDGGDFTKYQTVYNPGDNRNEDYPYGWNLYHGDKNRSRIMGGTEGSSNTGLSASSSGKVLLLKFNATYGETEGYTMPLKAGKIYKFTFKHGRWAEANPRNTDVVMTDPSGASITLAPAFQAATDNCQSNSENWYTYTGYFVSTTAGDYKFNLTKQGGNKQMQIAIADIDLRTASALELSQNNVVAYAAGTYPRVTISDRILFDTDKWNTLCLPFDMAASNFGSVKEITEVTTSGENVTLTMSSVDGTLAAGNVYFVKAKSASQVVSAEDVTMEAYSENPSSSSIKSGDDKTTVEIIGNYKKKTISDGEWFLGTDNKFYFADTEVNVRGYRATFTVTTEALVKSLFFSFDEDSTGINVVENEQADNAPIYNLAGQRLNKAQKGVNIINGKKVLVK